MIDRKISLWFILGGATAILGGIALAMTGTDGTVPNDPDIGAGLLLLGGFALGVSGLVMWLLDRR